MGISFAWIANMNSSSKLACWPPGTADLGRDALDPRLDPNGNVLGAIGSGFMNSFCLFNDPLLFFFLSPLSDLTGLRGDLASAAFFPLDFFFGEAGSFAADFTFGTG